MNATPICALCSTTVDKTRLQYFLLLQMHTLEDNLVIVYGGRSGTTESTISSDIKLLDAKVSLGDHVPYPDHHH